MLQDTRYEERYVIVLMQQLNIPRQMKLRYLRLIYGSVCLMLLGVMYAWSVYAPRIRESLACSVQDCSWAFTLSVVSFCVGGILSSFISRRVTPKLTLALAALALLAGFLSASYAANIRQFYGCYSVVTALGLGMGYNVLISLVNSWFSDKKGIVAGLLMLCFGLGGMLMGSLGEKLMALWGWQQTYRVYAVMLFVLLLFSVSFMRYPGTGNSFPPDAKGAAHTQTHEKKQYTPGQMLHRKSFWLYFIWCTLLPVGGLIAISNATAISGQFSPDEHFGVFCVGFLSIVGGVARIIWGPLYDKIGRRKTMRLLSFVAICSSLSFFAAYQSGKLAVLIAAFFLIAFVYGGCPPINTEFLQEFYGLEYFTVNFSILNISLLVASLCSGTISNVVFTFTGSFASGAWVMLLFYVIAAFTASRINEP